MDDQTKHLAFARATMEYRGRLNATQEGTYERACVDLDMRAWKVAIEQKITYSAAKQQVLSEDATLASIYTAGPCLGAKPAMTREEAITELDKRAQALVAEKKLTYTAAKHKALEQDEALAAAYTSEPSAPAALAAAQFTAGGESLDTGDKLRTAEQALDFFPPFQGNPASAPAVLDRRVKRLQLLYRHLSYAEAKETALRDDPALAAAYVAGVPDYVMPGLVA